MTTRNKVITGFLLMVFLSGVIAILGYWDLEKTSDRFTEYNRLAEFGLRLRATENEASRAMYKSYQTVATNRVQLMADAVKYMENLRKNAQDLSEQAKNPQRKEELKAIVGASNEFLKVQNAIRDNMQSMNTQFAEHVIPSGLTLAERLDELSNLSRELGNITVANHVAEALTFFGRYASSMNQFILTRQTKDADTMQKGLLDLTQLLRKLDAELQTARGKKISSALMDANADLINAVRVVVQATKSVNDSLAALEKISDQGDKVLGAIVASVHKEQVDLGETTLEANVAAQRSLLMVSSGVVVLGLLCAAFIIVGLSRVLRDLSNYATAISRGNFNFELKSREKGEIGSMIAAMKQIPDTLTAILNQYRGLEKDVEVGKLTAEGDASRFQGDFAVLIRGTNAILRRFQTVIDSIPTPVVVLDKDLKVAYLNTIAIDICGTKDYVGKSGHQLYSRDDYGTPDDALGKAVSARHAVSAETCIHPQGKTMEISYTAIPMFDEKGDLASVVQLITDLTQIKSTQRTIIDVANQASEISNRVAAASEELAAQVEEVSRGAEVQRSRVESTASAMTEMNATVLEIARSAGEASEQAENTRQKASQGAELVNKVMMAINTVNSVGHNLQVNMQELGKQAESIGNVMNVISDIADQTNLLALNAAIEAARAGEAGRGFAVVADEVRKLAEKTMGATQEVGSSIDAVQHSARVNIEEVEKAVVSVSEANNLANSSGDALTEIVNLAAANSSVVASIAAAAEEQSATSEEINRAIDEINQIVAENTQGMVQSSSAVQDLSSMAQELRRVMEGLTV